MPRVVREQVFTLRHHAVVDEPWSVLQQLSADPNPHHVGVTSRESEPDAYPQADRTSISHVVVVSEKSGEEIRAEEFVCLTIRGFIGTIPGVLAVGAHLEPSKCWRTATTTASSSRRARRRPKATKPGQLPPRPGNRLRYLAAAVEPLRTQLGDQRIQKLVAGLALCVGIESVVVTRDICGLDDTDAEELKQWMANALLQQATRDAEEESDAR